MLENGRRRRKRNRSRRSKEETTLTTKRQSRLTRAHHRYKKDVAGLGARANRNIAEIVDRDFREIKSQCPKPCAPLIRLLKYIMLLILTYSIYDATMTTVNAPSRVAGKSM